MATQTMQPSVVAPPTPEEHAKRFRKTHKGKGLSDKQIDNICSAILSSQKAPVDEDHADYYKMNLASAIFYINVMVNVRNPDAPARFFKSFVGHCGGLAIPGDSYFEAASLYPCAPYTYEDIFNNQVAIEVDSEALFCFLRFFDKDSHLLGYMWGAGAGDVIGVMGGTGKWKDGYLT